MCDFAPHLVFVAVERTAPGQDMRTKHTKRDAKLIGCNGSCVHLPSLADSSVWLLSFPRVHRLRLAVAEDEHTVDLFRRFLASSARASPLQAFCARCGGHAMLHGVLLVRVCMQAVLCHSIRSTYDMLCAFCLILRSHQRLWRMVVDPSLP